MTLMFARQNRYSAAYTHHSPSRDPELVELATWATQRPGTGLTVVGATAKSLDRSPVAQGLVKRGADFTYLRARGWGRAERVIALWPDRKGLGALDGVSTLTALAVLTWNIDEVLPWAAGMGALDVLGVAPANAGPASISDPLTLGALRSVTNAANLSTGLSNSSDYNYALVALKEVRRQGRTLDRDAVEAWAVANGWTYRHATEDLGELVAEIGAGKTKRFRGSGYSHRPTKELVKLWLEIGNDTNWSPF